MPFTSSVALFLINGRLSVLCGRKMGEEEGCGKRMKGLFFVRVFSSATGDTYHLKTQNSRIHQVDDYVNALMK